jgi:restriction endonuclease S subunit
LLFDKETAKTTKNVLFVKIQHDGFDLGAQRREIDKNDLPLTLNIIKKFKATLSDSEFSEDEKQLAHVVAKEKIIESGDYNLSGERYKEVVSFVNQKWPIIKLGKLCSIKTGKKDVNRGNPNGKYPFFTCAKEATRSDEFSFDTEAILIAGNGDVGAVKYYKGKFEAYQRTYVLDEFSEKVLPLFLYYFLNLTLKPAVSSQKLGNTMPYIKMGMLSDFGIPLPPLEVQKEIVEQIEVKQKAIDHAKAVIESLERERRYFGQALRKLEGVEWVELGKIGKISMCKRIFKDQTTPKGDVPFYKIGTFGQKPDAYISQEIYDEYITKYPHPKKGDILISTSGTIGRTVVYDGEPAYYQDSNIVWIDNDEKLVTNEYLYHVFQSIRWTTAKGGTIERLYNKLIEKTKIPVPTIEIQKQLVAEAEKEEEIITANRRLIEIMERKIEEVLSNI